MSKYSTKFKRWFYSDKVQIEIRSFFNTWLSVMAVDGLLDLMALYNGDFSTSTLIALATACLRSAIKALLQLAFPKVFVVSRGAGEGSVSVQMTKAIDRVVVKKAK